MENKRKSVYIGVFVITTIIAICIAIYFAINSSSKEKQLQSEIDSLTSQNSNLASENQKIENENNESKKQIEEEKAKVKYAIPPYDSTKIKNKPENVEYSNVNIGCVDLISCTINADGDLVLSKTIDYVDKKVTYSGVDEKIEEFYQGTINDGDVELIILLTKTGNIYISEDVSVATNQYQGDFDLKFEKLDKVSNICRVVRTMSNRTFAQGSKVRVTFIGIDTEGNCYDLWYEYKGV